MKWKMCPSFSLLAFVISLLVGTRAEAQVPLLHLTFYNAGSGLSLQPTPPTALNGISITQESSIQNSQAQRWTLRAISKADPFSPTHYQIQNESTGLCLDNTNGNSADRTRVQQWACNLTSTTMQWMISSGSGSSFYVIKNVRTGKCLDVPSGSLQPGAVIQIYRCTNSATVTNWAQLFGFGGLVGPVPA